MMDSQGDRMADIKHGDVDTGPSGFKRIDKYRVFIKIVFFSKILKYSGLWPFSVSLSVSVCTHNRQVEHHRCSRTGRNQKIFRKKQNI